MILPSQYLFSQTYSEYPRDQTVHGLFEERILKCGEEIAVVYRDKKLSYRELNSRANRVARYIRKKYRKLVGEELRGDTLVGICVERSLEMIIGIIAIMKAGGAYVPIDPEYPEERIKYILSDSGAKIVLTQLEIGKEIKLLFREEGVESIDIDRDIFSEESEKNLNLNIPSNSLAYVIYTSGTTGKPKGVMIEHSSLSNRLLWMKKEFNLKKNDNILQKTPFVFDVSVWELLLPLISSGKLVFLLPKYHLDSHFIIEAIRLYSITRIHFVPAALDLFIYTLESIKDANIDSLLTVFCSGEALKQKSCERFTKLYPIIDIYNLYGPTEATIDVTYYNAKKCITNEACIPIGYPIWNTSLYILDDNKQVVPRGTVGELYIGGEGVARGYLNLDTENKKKFIDNIFPDKINKKFINKNKLYRTGDLCIMDNDGIIKYLGRNDSQIKLRGHRIELSEIEAVANQYKGIKRSAVILHNPKYDKENIYDTSYLVMYYEADKVLDEQNIIFFLSQYLPTYMIPSKIIHLFKIPTSVSGKIDLNSLVEDSYNTNVLPNNPIEIVLHKIWLEVFQRDKISVEDNFFELGGSSLSAMVISSLIRSRLNIILSTIQILANPTIKQIAKLCISTNLPFKENEYNTISKLPIYFTEKQILLHHLTTEKKEIYNEHFVVEIFEEIEITRFINAIKETVNIFEGLKFNYITKNGNIKKIFNPNSLHKVILFDYTSIPEAEKLKNFKREIDSLVNIEFDLLQDSLIKFYIFKFEQSVYKMLLVFFHSILDGTSIIKIILPFIENYYYTNKKFIISNRNDSNLLYLKLKKLYNTNLQKSLHYWQNILNNAHPIILKNKNTDSKDSLGAQLNFKLDSSIKSKINFIAKKLNVSNFTILLSSFYMLLYKLTDNKSFICRSIIDERIYFPEHENTIGCFINNIFLHTNIDPNLSFADYIRSVHNNNLEAFENTIDYSTLLDKYRDMVLLNFPIGFVLEPKNNGKSNWHQCQTYTHPKNVEQDLYFELDEKNTEIFGRVLYKINKYSAWYIQSIVDSYINVLKQIDLNLTKVIKLISIIPDNQFQLITNNWNRYSDACYLPITLHSLFEHQVRKIPNTIAIRDSNSEISYMKLNMYSNYLSQHILSVLKSHNSRKNMIILYLRRSIDMIAAIIGVLKSGNSYVPIDYEFPEERIAFILKDTSADIIITTSNLFNDISRIVSDFGYTNISIIVIDRDLDISKFVLYEDNYNNNVDSSDLAYVIYTSGTTGVPKGVLVEHGNAANLVCNQVKELGQYFKVALLSCTYIFDAFVEQMWTTLAVGGLIVVVTNEELLNPDKLKKIIKNNEATCLNMSSTLLQSLQGVDLESIKLVITGGEICPKKLVEKYIPTSIVVNSYGPTETTITSHQFIIHNLNQLNSYDTVPIGKQINNVTSYILDPYLNLMPFGAVGELYIGGKGVSRGYLNRLDLNQEKFVKNPFVEVYNENNCFNNILYKTGDLCRMLPNGEIEYVGRNDNQIKIRGYRVELEEIEQVISHYHLIDKAVISAYGENEQRYLVCYYTLLSNKSNHVNLQYEIEEFLKEKLPYYMIPQYYFLLDSFPTLLNGKLDKNKIAQITPLIQSKTHFPPITCEEKIIADVWAEILNINKEHLSINDSFFRLGGNSLLALKAAYQISKKLRINFNLSDIYLNDTIRKSAQALLLLKKEILQEGEI